MRVLVKEMDGIPDMECEATIASELNIFRSLSDIVDHVPSFLYLDKNGISISYFIDKKEVKSARNLEIFKREFQCRSFGDLSYIVNEQAGMPSIQNYEKLLAIPSVVLNYKYLEDGVHHIIFNFSNLIWIIFQLHAGVAQTRNFFHNVECSGNPTVFSKVRYTESR